MAAAGRNKLYLAVALVIGVAAGAAAQKTADKKAEEKKRILMENARVRVREVLIEPGVAYPAHTHQYPHVGVIVKGGKLEFTEKGKADAVEFKDGDAGWREGGVTHSVRNLSKTTVHVVEVELK
jgi:quercetin dioxygenase-like cupin family protein